MADKQEISEDIIAEMRGGPIPQRHDRELLCYFADRLEAAIRREKAAVEADALEVGGIVGAAHRREAASMERIVRDAIVGYRELLAIAPNDEAEAELKARAEAANIWLARHGFAKEKIAWTKEEASEL